MDVINKLNITYVMEKRYVVFQLINPNQGEQFYEPVKPHYNLVDAGGGLMMSEEDAIEYIKTLKRGTYTFLPIYDSYE